MAHAAPRVEPAPATALARVLATETRLDEEVAEAGAQAARIIEAAEAEAAALLSALEAELREAEAGLENRLIREQEARLEDRRRAAEQALAALAAHRALVGELSDWVVQRIVTPETAS